MKGTRSGAALRIVGLLILLWLLWRTDLELLGRILREARWSYVLIAVGFVTASLLVKWGRYQYILSVQGVQNPFRKTVHYSLAALYLSFVTPGRVGEASKAYFIHRRSGAPLGKLIAGMTIDRALDVYPLLAVALLGLLVLSPGGGIHAGQVVPVIAAVALAPLAFLVDPVREALVRLVALLQRKLTGRESGTRHLREFFDEIDVLLSWRLAVGIAMSAAAYALFFAACFALVLSLSVGLDYGTVAVFTAVANILSFLPVTFAGIGTREAALAYLFGTEGLGTESALAYSALLFAVTYLLVGIVGLVSLSTIEYAREDLTEGSMFRDRGH